MLAIIALLFLYLNTVSCENEKESANMIEDRIIGNLKESIEHMRADKSSPSRIPKFLSINKEANKVRVEASFAVPLLTIPVGGETIDTVHGENTATIIPKIDVNLKSVVTVASIFLLVFVLLPKILKFHSPPILDGQNFRSDMDRSMVDFVRRISETLESYDVDFKTCSQKALCWTMNNVIHKVEDGSASGPEKLLDALSSMPYLKYVFEDTWLWSLMEKAITFRDVRKEHCEEFNKKCAITSNGLNLAASSLLSSVKSKHL